MPENTQEVPVAPQSRAGEDAEQLRDDIEILRLMVDAALDNGLDHRLLAACTSVLRDRKERLERIGRRNGLRAA